MKEALKKDISKQDGTYTNCIRANMKELNRITEDRTIDRDTYIQLVLDMIKDAHDTPAKRNFIDNLQKRNTKTEAMRYVYNAFMAGCGLGVNIIKG